MINGAQYFKVSLHFPASFLKSSKAQNSGLVDVFDPSRMTTLSSNYLLANAALNASTFSRCTLYFPVQRIPSIPADIMLLLGVASALQTHNFLLEYSQPRFLSDIFLNSLVQP